MRHCAHVFLRRYHARRAKREMRVLAYKTGQVLKTPLSFLTLMDTFLFAWDDMLRLQQKPRSVSSHLVCLCASLPLD